MTAPKRRARLPDAREIVYRDVGQLVPYAKNARTHSEAQIEAIARSIDEFGFTNPILVDEHLGIVAGHGRVLAAQLRGITTVPTVMLVGFTPAQVQAYVIADNQLALLAGWDVDLLKSELAELKLADIDLSLLGFSEIQLDELLSPSKAKGPPGADELPDAGPPVSVAGDMWKLGNHRVLCGDATRVDHYGILLAGKVADAIWTDPPYNVDYKRGGSAPIENDHLPNDRFREFLDASFRGMFAAVRPGGGVYISHADTEGLNFRAAFAHVGFKLSGVLVWRKDSLVLGRSDYQWIHEPILYGWRPGHRHRWGGGRKQTTDLGAFGDPSPFREIEPGVWGVQVGEEILVIEGKASVRSVLPSIFQEPKPKRSVDHPTMKPVALIERMLRNSTRAGDVVLDAFGGSGSTLIACERLGLSARLIEIAPGYVDVIVRRWQEYTGRQAVHVVTGRKFAVAKKAPAATP